MRLTEEFLADINKTYELYMSFNKDENGFENVCYGMNLSEFKEYLKHSSDEDKGINLPNGYVPCTHYVLVNDNDDYVGIFSFRHELNDFLRNGPGHIGFVINKKYRNKGYASEGLKLVFEKCKEKNIKEVYMSCNKDNEASLKTQLKAGAYIHHQDDEYYYTRTLLK